MSAKGIGTTEKDRREPFPLLFQLSKVLWNRHEGGLQGSRQKGDSSTGAWIMEKETELSN